MNRNAGQQDKEVIRLEKLMTARWRELTALYGPPVLYGAGKHTDWLAGLVSSAGLEMPREIWDDNPRIPAIYGVPVVKTPKRFSRGVRLVVLSTDVCQEAMRRSLESLGGPRPEIIDLYDGAIRPVPGGKAIWAVSRSRISKGPMLTREGYRIVYDAKSPQAFRLRQAVAAGEYEKEDMDLMRRIVRPGDTVVDIGAHEGFFTLLFAGLVGERGRVFSFEPNPENLRYLRRNVKLNRGKCVRIYPVAAGSGRGNGILHLNEGQGAWGSFTDFWGDTTRERRVAVETLDHALGSMGGRIDFIKVDTEGHDFEVLKGAAGLLKRYHPGLCVEVSLSFWSVMSASLDDMLNFLKDMGYKLYVCINGRLQPYLWPHERVFNLYAFLPRDIRRLPKSMFKGKE